MRMRSVIGVGIVVATIACGASSGDSDRSFERNDDDPNGGSSGFGGEGDGGKSGPCKGLACQIPACTNGSKTTLSGTVYAPTPAKFGKADPIYNAILYVPNAELQPFPAAVSCDKCGTITSGEPIVTALSAADGKFVLENVPAGEDIPIVIQVGRWRRKVVVPKIEPCTDNALSAEQTRLPRNKAEGDIPLFAVATSPYDPTECILRKIGIDDAEFTPPSGEGRVHLYKGAGSTVPGAPAASALWGNVDTLKRYDILALPCQDNPGAKPDAAGLGNIARYADQGGRAFVTDLSQDVVSKGPADWRTTATFGGGGIYRNPAHVDESFPKGKALAEWLFATGATAKRGELQLEDTYTRFTTVNPPAQRFVYSASSPQTYAFNTPVAAKEADQCGRVVLSSFHVAAANVGKIGTFPASCDSAPLTAQEKVLEFLLFDLAACVQKDDKPPTPPPPVN